MAEYVQKHGLTMADGERMAKRTNEVIDRMLFLVNQVKGK